MLIDFLAARAIRAAVRQRGRPGGLVDEKQGPAAVRHFIVTATDPILHGNSDL